MYLCFSNWLQGLVSFYLSLAIFEKTVHWNTAELFYLMKILTLNKHTNIMYVMYVANSNDQTIFNPHQKWFLPFKIMLFC